MCYCSNLYVNLTSFALGFTLQLCKTLLVCSYSRSRVKKWNELVIQFHSVTLQVYDTAIINFFLWQKLHNSVAHNINKTFCKTYISFTCTVLFIPSIILFFSVVCHINQHTSQTWSLSFLFTWLIRYKFTSVLICFSHAQPLVY